MSRCTEPLLWFCSSCSHPFEMGEWEGHDRSCPVCHSKSGVWRCGKCSGEFDQPSLGSEHPCLAKPKPSHGTKLVSRSRGRATPTPRLTPELPQDSQVQIKTEIFEHFLKEQSVPPVLASEAAQPKMQSPKPQGYLAVPLPVVVHPRARVHVAISPCLCALPVPVAALQFARKD
jgi:DNA-directed RNA polymerase subunit RPC12/RpoP